MAAPKYQRSRATTNFPDGVQVTQAVMALERWAIETENYVNALEAQITGQSAPRERPVPPEPAEEPPTEPAEAETPAEGASPEVEPGSTTHGAVA